jgi:hypothetical protein
MQCILYKIYFWKGFSYIPQIDMPLICAPMLTNFYSCKKWVLQFAMRHICFESLGMSDLLNKALPLMAMVAKLSLCDSKLSSFEFHSWLT